MANQCLINWKRTAIGGKPADVFEPSAGGPYDAAVIYLHAHGLETLATDAEFTAQLDGAGLPCVAPHAGKSWWLDRICPEFDEAITPMDHVRHQVVHWIGETWHVSPPHIGLLGISMGGQGALQIAYRDARRFPVVAAISPAIDFHGVHGQGWELDQMFETAEAARQQTATLQLHPLNWPAHQLIVCDPTDAWHAGCERLVSKLSSIGIPYEADLETQAGGHSWLYFRSMAKRSIQFLADRLRRRGGSVTG